MLAGRSDHYCCPSHGLSWLGFTQAAACTRLSSPHSVRCAVAVAVTRCCGVALTDNLTEGRFLNPRVLPDLLPGQKVVLLSREERPAQKPLPFGQGFGQRLAGGLGQQRDANDAEQGAARQDDVVKEEAFLVVELHERGG